jgi:hypothetical protein
VRSQLAQSLRHAVPDDAVDPDERGRRSASTGLLEPLPSHAGSHGARRARHWLARDAREAGRRPRFERSIAISPSTRYG